MNSQALKIAVLGAGNIGKFHIREFIAAGAEPVAILGSTNESAQAKSEILNSEFGINLKAYADLELLLKQEKIHAVTICTPPPLHSAQVEACINAGLHVLCEKPLVLDSFANNYPIAQRLAGLAKAQNKILTVNTQWPAMLEAIAKQIDISEVNSLFVFSQPGAKGAEMLADHLPHANSILFKLIPLGWAENIIFSSGSNEDLAINFNFISDAGLCKVNYRFKYKADRPRDLKFAINGQEFAREIGQDYKQSLVSGSGRIEIEDPLKVSIVRFISAIQDLGNPLITESQMLENVKLQDRLSSAYQKFIHSS